MKNPGAEADTAEWISLINRIETSSYAHSGDKSFSHRGLNGGGDGYLVVEQRISLSAYASAIDSEHSEAIIGMWSDTSNDLAGFILEFLDSIGIAMGDWKNGKRRVED